MEEMANNSLIDRYINALASGVLDAKHNADWKIISDKGDVINSESPSHRILDNMGAFTVEEFIALTKGCENLEIKELVFPDEGPEDLPEGIYIEKCNPEKASKKGRHYAIIKDGKRLDINLKTKENKKGLNFLFGEMHGDYLYLCSSITDEIKIVYQYEPYNSNYAYNFKRGDLLGNKVFNGEIPDEAGINELFEMGIVKFIENNPLTIHYPYDEEIDDVKSWHR